MKKVELVFVPYPFWSHLTPTIEFAKHLFSGDDRISITMLVTKPYFDPKFADYVDSLASASTSSDRIKFIALQDGTVLTETSSINHNVALSLYMELQKPHVKNAVSELLVQYTKLAGFVVDQLCSCMIDVADELRVPSYAFFTVSAGYVGLMFHLQALCYEQNINPAELKRDDPDAELVLPSFVSPVPIRTFPQQVVDKASCLLFLNHYRRIKERAKGVIVNTFKELEPMAVDFLASNDHFPPVYPVGPAIKLEASDGHVASRGDNNEFDIIKWLDDQPRSSVLYLCFGNLGCFGDDQVKEIARALENSGTPFLWSLRQRPSTSAGDSYIQPSSGPNEPMEVFVKEFLDRTAGKGKIIGWAPQVAILAHPAVGGFVSHCGWNSVLESLWFGVPIATWPLYAEQQFNAFELVKELELAVDIKMDYVMDFHGGSDGVVVVSAHEIEAKIRKLMEPDSDLRKKTNQIRETSGKALMDGGSSHSFLEHLINGIINGTPC